MTDFQCRDTLIDNGAVGGHLQRVPQHYERITCTHNVYLPREFVINNHGSLNRPTSLTFRWAESQAL